MGFKMKMLLVSLMRGTILKLMDDSRFSSSHSFQPALTPPIYSGIKKMVAVPTTGYTYQGVCVQKYAFFVLRQSPAV